MKKYTCPTVYRGYQIFKVVCAKTNKEAAEKLNTSLYYINNYVYKTEIDDVFEGIMAYCDDQFLIEDRSLLRVEMPLERLGAIIDSYKDESYQVFKKQMGIE